MAEELDGQSRQAIFKIEPVRGTYSAPDYTTDFNVTTFDLSDINIDAGHTGGNNGANGLMGMTKSLSGRKQAPVDFSVALRADADIAVAPKWWKFLQACGWVVDETGLNATATWDGRPSCFSLSGEFPLWECGSDPDGEADVLAGMAGTVEFGADEVGGEILAKFTFTGKAGEPKALGTGTFVVPSGEDAVDGQTYIGVTVVKGAATYKAWTWAVAQNADVQSVNDAADVTNGAKTGISHFKVGNAEPSATIDATRISTNTDVVDMFDNVVDTALTITMDNFELVLSDGVQNVAVARGTQNETGTDNINVKFRKMVLTRI
jgi:hypothetical protein